MSYFGPCPNVGELVLDQEAMAVTGTQQSAGDRFVSASDRVEARLFQDTDPSLLGCAKCVSTDHPVVVMYGASWELDDLSVQAKAILNVDSKGASDGSGDDEDEDGRSSGACSGLQAAIDPTSDLPHHSWLDRPHGLPSICGNTLPTAADGPLVWNPARCTRRREIMISFKRLRHGGHHPHYSALVPQPNVIEV